MGSDMHCLKCGYDWIPRVDIPKECPRCRSRYYGIERIRKAKAPVYKQSLIKE